NIQRLLDMLMPNFLAVVVVFVSYRLLGKRKVTMIQLVLVVLALSIVGTALGILG
ncbi:MAG: PTS system mannose/fructose/sorbose family transporter subunit IID, partial [Erysipelotrichaceae bacterium]|nr:PTS system mannose/fructose/sorbose family transporter subunit IID [Erysipelotrichaceae bacterium]